MYQAKNVLDTDLIKFLNAFCELPFLFTFILKLQKFSHLYQIGSFFNITQEAYAFIVKELTEPHTQKREKKTPGKLFLE